MFIHHYSGMEISLDSKSSLGVKRPLKAVLNFQNKDMFRLSFTDGYKEYKGGKPSGMTLTLSSNPLDPNFQKGRQNCQN